MAANLDTSTGPLTRRATRRVWGLVALLAAAAAVVGTLWHLSRNQPPPEPAVGAAIEVPLGVEEAMVVRYTGPQLVPRPYRRGASVSVRIARQAQHQDVWVYDVRYVVNLPGQFDITEYLVAATGDPIDDLPSFPVRGVTRLTKDMETRIREIEDVEINIGHWYYESLVGLGGLWAVWLVGLIFLGRHRHRLQPTTQHVAPPTLRERIEKYLRQMTDQVLDVQQRAELEVLLIQYWREQRGLSQRLAESCRCLQADPQFGAAYTALQVWLHAPGNDDMARRVQQLCQPGGTAQELQP